jgi:hypothetical protein
MNRPGITSRPTGAKDTSIVSAMCYTPPAADLPRPYL